jgi:site-specific recombinase XerD
VRISARKGLVVVRSGKGEAYREVELNALVRAMLDEWVDARKKIARDNGTSFFVSRTGNGLSSRSIDLAVRRVAARARLELSAHVLRHTFVTGLVRAGNDLVLVAELAGHRRLETTRRYSLPSKADRQKAVSDLEIDF